MGPNGTRSTLFESPVVSPPTALRRPTWGASYDRVGGRADPEGPPSGQASTAAILPPVEQRITPAAAAQLRLPLCTIGRTYSSEPVPTDIEVGPDGMWYVSSLPGSPELPGYGAVYRVNPGNGAVNLVARGFSGAVDLAVADDGTIYVAELNANRISSISNGVISPVDVFSPGAIEIGADGTIYATTGVFGPSGNVVIVTP